MIYPITKQESQSKVTNFQLLRDMHGSIDGHPHLKDGTTLTGLERDGSVLSGNLKTFI